MEADYSLTKDLGKYVEVILRQLRLIIGVAFIFVIAAGLVSFFLPKTYQASALVATIKSATEVSFGSGIETLSEEQLSSIRVDPNARLQSYVNMVRHPEVAQKVLDELGSELPSEDRSISSLLNIISGNVVGRSDLIEISATYDNPVLAAEIANSWSRAYVDKVNDLYSTSGKEESLIVIQQQTENARQDYDVSQEELVGFLTENKVGEYTRQISETLTTIDNLYFARSYAVSEIISGTVQTQVSVIDEHNNNLQENLVQTYEDLRKTNRLLNDAEDMRTQVREGGQGAATSNALALILLKSQAFASNEALNNLQIQTSPVGLTQEEMLADLDALVEALEARKITLEREIQSLSQQILLRQQEAENVIPSPADGEDLLGGNASAVLLLISQLGGLEGLAELHEGEAGIEGEIQQLEDRLNTYHAQLAIEQDREQELRRARDLAWSTYETLTTKEAELAIASQARDTQVVLASPATVPTGDTISSTNNMAIAGAAGLLLGVAAAYFIEFWWSYKGVKPYAITFRRLFRREK